MDCSLPGSSIHGISQARILEWAAIHFSGEFHGQRSLAGCSPWGHKESDMTEQLTLSLFLSPGDLPEPGIKPESPALQANSLPLSHEGSIYICICIHIYICVCVFWGVFLAEAHGLWDFSNSTRNETQALSSESTEHGILTAGLPGNFFISLS